MSSSICPYCGNTIVGGVCPNCRKIESDRRKRWRTGDRAGKEIPRDPARERRPRPTKAQAKRPAYDARSASPPHRPPESMRSSARTLAEALNGVWRDEEGRVSSLLDTKNGVYRSQRPNRPWSREYQLKVRGVEGQFIVYYREEMRISGQLEDDGFLTLLAENRLFRFVCVHRDEEVRVCPKCYSRTERHKKYCIVCGWRYVYRRAPY